MGRRHKKGKKTCGSLLWHFCRKSKSCTHKPGKIRNSFVTTPWQRDVQPLLGQQTLSINNTCTNTITANITPFSCLTGAVLAEAHHSVDIPVVSLGALDRQCALPASCHLQLEAFWMGMGGSGEGESSRFHFPPWELKFCLFSVPQNWEWQDNDRGHCQDGRPKLTIFHSIWYCVHQEKLRIKKKTGGFRNGVKEHNWCNKDKPHSSTLKLAFVWDTGFCYSSVCGLGRFFACEKTLW